MNENIMRAAGFGKEVEMVKMGKCPMCGTVIHKDSFDGPLSFKEFQISGMCQTCQNDVFGKD